MAARSTDDDIDLEALQARIDLSMAFAHDLVSSWVNPSLKSSTGTRKDYEKELEEYMRRPPRLGVGAPIPESTTQFRETARLKKHLTKVDGKKRAREEEDNIQRHYSDDEEESRAGAIKKKPKVDIFTKPKRKSGNILPKPLSAPGSLNAMFVSGERAFEAGARNETERVTQPAVSISSPGFSAKTKRKKRRKPSAITGNSASPNLLSPAVPTPAQDSTASPRDKVGQLNSVQISPPSQSNTKGMSDDNTTEVFDISTPIPLSSPKRLVVSYDMVHKLPLLNLDGPPGDKHDDPQIFPSGIAKRRKRKRNRKRRSSLADHSKGRVVLDN